MRFAQGFTIVELITMIVVVGILVGLGTFAFGQVQQNARNDERAADIAVIADGLERYHDKFHSYPSCANMTQQAAKDSAYILGVDQNSFTSPSDKSKVISPSDKSKVNSFTCTALSSSGPDVYAYIGNSGAECATGDFCTEYTLQYKREGSNEIISTESIR